MQTNNHHPIQHTYKRPRCGRPFNNNSTHGAMGFQVQMTMRLQH